MVTDTKSSSSHSPAVHHSHVKAAEHNDAASAAHKEAAKHIDAGDHKQAGFHAAVAHGHTIQAHEHGKTALSTIANSASAKK
jgi:hypothetical protein